MGLSLREAAKEAGVSKSTILRAVRAGRLSAERTPDGGYSITPSELFRVYEPGGAQRSDNDNVDQGAPANDTAAQDAEAAAAMAKLEAELAGLKELVRRLDEGAEDLKQDRDRWRQMAESNQRLLTDARQDLETAKARPWWKLWAS